MGQFLRRWRIPIGCAAILRDKALDLSSKVRTKTSTLNQLHHFWQLTTFNGSHTELRRIELSTKINNDINIPQTTPFRLNLHPTPTRLLILSSTTLRPSTSPASSCIRTLNNHRLRNSDFPRHLPHHNRLRNRNPSTRKTLLIRRAHTDR